ncbi:MAG: DNA polymerase IV [Gracilibacteraceae bacterium]|jgi:DNA polymerase-4|nr:DNA polymerase IV [Gracilibacteraceae bacterium]
MKDRVILHVDMNAFFASVEALFHPETAGKAMAVAGDPENRRGIILAKNELAKKAGVQTAEPIWQARRKCPGLILLPPHHDLYEEYCIRANEIYRRFSDLTEQAGIDESYLDVTGSEHIFGSGEKTADAIRAAVKEELGLTVSVGVSFCKVFAKMGSDLRKPDKTSVISRENYRDILYPLPVTNLMFVGKATAKTLAGLGVRTIGQLAAIRENDLAALLGKHGRLLYAYAHGLDNEPVRRADDARDVKSIGNSLTFRRDLVSLNDISVGLRALSESVAYRLRRHGKKCYGVQVSIKDPSFSTIDRQVRLPGPTHLARTIHAAALDLVRRSWKPGKPIRLLAVTAIGLTGESDGGQMALFEDNSVAKQEALEKSIDELRQKYGKHVIKPASVLHNDLGIGT